MVGDEYGEGVDREEEEKIKNISMKQKHKTEGWSYELWALILEGYQ